MQEQIPEYVVWSEDTVVESTGSDWWECVKKRRWGREEEGGVGWGEEKMVEEVGCVGGCVCTPE